MASNIKNQKPKKPPLPKHVYVLGTKIRIKVVKAITENGVDCLGCYYGDDKLIMVVQHPHMNETLLHEICHAILDLSGANECLDHTQEESLVVALTTGITSLRF